VRLADVDEEELEPVLVSLVEGEDVT